MTLVHSLKTVVKETPRGRKRERERVRPAKARGEVRRGGVRRREVRRKRKQMGARER